MHASTQAARRTIVRRSRRWGFSRLVGLLALSTALGDSTAIAAAEKVAFRPPTGRLPCRDGVAGPYRCKSVDQAAFLGLKSLGGPVDTLLRDIDGWVDVESGRRFALVALEDAVAVVEVTDPVRSRRLGRFVPAPGTEVYDIAVFSDALYALTFSGTNFSVATLEAFDLRAALDAKPGFSLAATSNTGVQGHPQITVNPSSERAYLFNSLQNQPGAVTGLTLAPDALRPQHLFDWVPSKSQTFGLECVVYAGPDVARQGRDICFGATNPGSLTIDDLTESDAPVRLAKVRYRGERSPWRTAVSADHRFVLLADSHDEYFYRRNTRTFVFDVQDLAAPVFKTWFAGPTPTRDLDLEIHGRFAYIANGRDGLRILDLQHLADGRLEDQAWFDSDPTSAATDWWGAIGVDVLPGGTVLLIDSRLGLFVLRPSLPPS